MYNRLTKLSIILIVVITSFFINVSGANSPNYITTKKAVQAIDTNNLSLKKLEVALIVDTFLQQLIEADIRLNQSENSDYIKIDILFSDFDKKYNHKYNNTIAIALGSNIDSIVQLDINENIWNQLTEIERYSTICHEVCHDLFNVQHIEGDALNLMHPSSQPVNMNEFQIMIKKFIRDYKTGRVKKFKEGFYIHDNTHKKAPYIIESL